VDLRGRDHRSRTANRARTCAGRRFNREKPPHREVTSSTLVSLVASGSGGSRDGDGKGSVRARGEFSAADLESTPPPVRCHVRVYQTTSGWTVVVVLRRSLGGPRGMGQLAARRRATAHRTGRQPRRESRLRDDSGPLRRALPAVQREGARDGSGRIRRVQHRGLPARDSATTGFTRRRAGSRDRRRATRATKKGTGSSPNAKNGPSRRPSRPATSRGRARSSSPNSPKTWDRARARSPSDFDALKLAS